MIKILNNKVKKIFDDKIDKINQPIAQNILNDSNKTIEKKITVIEKEK